MSVVETQDVLLERNMGAGQFVNYESRQTDSTLYINREATFLLYSSV